MNCSSNEKAKDFYISHNQITSHLPVFNKTHLLYKSLVFVRLWLCVCLLVNQVGFFDEDGGFNSIYIFPFCKLCFDPPILFCWNNISESSRKSIISGWTTSGHSFEFIKNKTIVDFNDKKKSEDNIFMSTCFVAPSLNYLMRLLHIIDISKLHTRCIIEAIPFTKYKA